MKESAVKSHINDCAVLASLELRLPIVVVGRAEKFRKGVADQEILIKDHCPVFIESKRDKKKHDYSKEQIAVAKQLYHIVGYHTYGVESPDKKVFKIHPLCNREWEYEVTDLQSEIKRWIINSMERREIIKCTISQDSL